MKQNPLFRLLRYLKPNKRDYALGISYSCLNKLFDIAPEILIGVAVDTVVKRDQSLLASLGYSNTKEQLFILGILTFAIWSFESLFQFLYSIKWRQLAQLAQHRLRLEAYDHVQHLDLGTLETKTTGGLLTVLNDDVNQLERFLEGGVNEILQVLVSTLVIGGLFFIVAPDIAVVAFLPIPLILFGTFYFQNRLAQRFLDVREKAAQLGARLNNNLSGIVTIKSFTSEAFEIEQVALDSVQYQEANNKVITLSSAVTPIIRIAVLAGFLGTLILGGFQTIQGTMSVGIFSALVFLTQRLLWPLTRLAEITVLYQRAMASASRIFDLIELPIHIRSGNKEIESKDAQGSIAFENVNFSYGNFQALSSLNITIPAGKTVAFVGESGSGKSTLIKLLLRFYQPNQGRIVLDGIDIAQLRVPLLRQLMALVSQDVYLFQGTIAENIAYAMPETDLNHIKEAAQKAEAHDFIMQLPKGYNTPVGERGYRLSGGQRQRIAIARAIIRDPRILILDEATSAVDNETEAAIQKSMANISKGRTTIIIAHRLSTIRHADIIYVLKAGAIVEQGTHEELISVNGHYSSLWKLQTGLVVG